MKENVERDIWENIIAKDFPEVMESTNSYIEGAQ